MHALGNGHLLEIFVIGGLNCRINRGQSSHTYRLSAHDLATPMTRIISTVAT